MTGTLINVLTVIVGGTIGMLIGNRLPERFRGLVISGLGLVTFGLGVQMFLKTQNALIVVGSVLVGALLGEWWGIEKGLIAVGKWFEDKFNRMNGNRKEGGDSRFVGAFVTTSVLYCVGPMAILGSIQDGLTGDYQVLAVKSMLDGFSAIMFASSLGAGVIFSAAPVLLYQGAIALLASQVQSIITEAMMNEMTAVGGILIMGIAISSLLEIKQIKVENMLPALAAAPIIVAIAALFG
jgi:uncharacterized membrane protein YqgA involved in biofilm formation